MLEHHCQAGTQHPQLVFIRHLQLTIFILHQINVLAADHNLARTRFFEEVDAAQEGTFTRP